jgi:hypothetical protein
MEENPVTEYTIDYIAAPDLPRAIRLLRDFIGSESYFGADDKYVQWQYFDSPFKTTMVDKDQYSMLVFLDANKNILALDAFLPWKTYVDGKEVKTVWDIEWMNFSKIKGLGKELVKKLRERTEIYCGYGMNQLSYNSFEKLGFAQKNEIERKVAILDEERCISLFGIDTMEDRRKFLRQSAVSNNIKNATYIIINDIHNISEDYWFNHIERFEVSSFKDLRALSWRYCEHPYIKYTIIGLDQDAKKGLAVVRLEKIRGVKENVLRILELMPGFGYEQDLTNAVLGFGYKHGAVLADYYCVSKEYCDQICTEPFIGLAEHRQHEIPMLFQPIEVRDRKSINMVLDCNKEWGHVSFDKFYATKGDGDQDQFVNEDYRTVSL